MSRKSQQTQDKGINKPSETVKESTKTTKSIEDINFDDVDWDKFYEENKEDIEAIKNCVNELKADHYFQKVVHYNKFKKRGYKVVDKVADTIYRLPDNPSDEYVDKFNERAEKRPLKFLLIAVVILCLFSIFCTVVYVKSHKRPVIEPAKTEEIVYEHVPGTGYLEISVEGPTGKKIQGATIDLYDDDGHFVNKVQSDINGKAVFNIDRPGIYYYKELSAPGYIKTIDSELHVVNYTEDNNEFYETITNEFLTGNIMFSVTTSRYKPVKDATIYVYNDETGYRNVIHTDKYGVAEIRDIPFGYYKYFVNDSKEAKGFSVEVADATFVIDIKIK